MNWKLQQHNLMEEYRVPDSDLRKYFQMMGAVAFVPEEDVAMAWRFLKLLLPADITEFTTFYDSTSILTSTASLSTNGTSTTLPRCCFLGVPISLKGGTTGAKFGNVSRKRAGVGLSRRGGGGAVV